MANYLLHCGHICCNVESSMWDRVENRSCAYCEGKVSSKYGCDACKARLKHSLEMTKNNPPSPKRGELDTV